MAWGTWNPRQALAIDCAVAVLGALAVASVLGIEFLLCGNLPTGGDTASHLLYVWTFVHELLPRGYLTAWMPEVFGGFPFLSYYFPLPFVAIAGLAAVLPFAQAMKLGMFAAAMALPAAAWWGSVRLLGMPRRVAIWGVLGILPFLWQEQHSIWGGNLLSTLAGEFAYGYGALFAVLTLCAWQRAIATERHWWLVAAVLEVATGASHGFALLVTGFATTAYLFDAPRFLRNLRLLVLGHGLAFLLLGGWLWPMMEMHALTVPNDAFFEVRQWRELLPAGMEPVVGGGLFAAMVLLASALLPGAGHRFAQSGTDALRHVAFFAVSTMLAAVGFLAAGLVGLANIRFFPFVWLLGGLACGWLWGYACMHVAQALPAAIRWGWHVLGLAAAVAFIGHVAVGIAVAPDWGLWNHSGLEAKPQWNRLSTLFPAMSGPPDGPRLLFEHDPANHDLGSTRVLEALPMFLGGRPVLEGLYMESALLGPAIYQLQSEVSRHPSSPLARFPSASMDLELAAEHMRFLYANDVLVRHPETVSAFAASPLFTPVTSAAPFHVFRVRDFHTHLVDLVDHGDQVLRWESRRRWMENAFAWFRSRSRFARELPVFHDGVPPTLATAAPDARIHDIRLDRHRIAWKTHAVGSAHLLRVAWHPRWQLATRGELFLAGPGLMLVVPQEASVVLEYGHTPIGIAGMVGTALGLAGLAWAIFAQRRQRVQHAPQPCLAPSGYWPRGWVAMLWPLLLVVLGVTLHVHNPERLYAKAWVAMRAQQFQQAADVFDKAFALRRGDAKQEEALFWAAKAAEQAGLPARAIKRYRLLVRDFHGYWLPESLYTLSTLEAQAGRTEQAIPLRHRLRQEYPHNRWTQRMEQELGQ
ncbi:6-pyruvoyl-tetrahydropterin synthase-related protein [Candidatus Symbiobacter mobilis]|uniref:TPR repeat protein n=1 Tax=Candidatus Symbiobacter mobilis CR TaxID=946483 RepID=U5N8Z4_9BURK|nr:6-pyruvoyl-tetrahydropterin synthase-related protein [Candidatus Symbiobacter mobilis]AGX87800.1 TPR repeat protein [Candidatus Symbiobacter mobilis CR]